MRSALLYVTVILLALITGALTAIVPWQLIVALILALTISIPVMKDPFWGLILIIATCMQVIPGAILPNIPLGGASILPHELLVILTFISVTLKTILRKDKSSLVKVEFFGSTLTIFGLLIIAILVSKFYFMQKDFIFPLLRNFMPLMLFPYLSLMLSDDDQVKRLQKYFIVFGVCIASFICIQSFGNVQLFAGRMEDLGLNDRVGITRTVLWGPELLIILSLFLIGSQGVRFCISNWWSIPALGILILGLIATYTRTFWISTLFGALLISFFSGGIKSSLRLILGAFPIVFLVGLIVSIINPHTAEVALDRFVGITQEVESGDSFGWRGLENKMAYEAIQKSPILGVGINGIYKQFLSSKGHFEGEEVYIHNAYLYFVLKMGVIGAAILVIFFYQYLRLSRAAFNIKNKVTRINVLIYAVMGLVIMLMGYSGQTISRFSTLLLICLMFTIMRFYGKRD